ncbi:MAG: hypothetical protein CVT49_05600 [candidate division Zixibacteria bacterium HGW-Zixibacteria-1]|nr:MAG: hypothetical protein CVT49_05600 [candidate division Zixibacteria bacterium HGW-Zixibacteria-1]
MTTAQFVSEHRRQLILIGLIFVIMVVLYGRIDTGRADYQHWDLHQYQMMAERSPMPPDDVSRPFAYRILGPYLAGLLPFDLDTSFYIFSLAVSAMLVFLFYRFLCSLKIERTAAALAVIIFIFNKYFFGFTVWNFYQLNDVLSLILILLLFFSIHRQQWLQYAIFLAVGAITRETVMIMVPVALIYLVEYGRFKQHILSWVMASLPGILIFIILRMVIVPAGGDDLWAAFLKYSGKLGSPGPWAGLTLFCTIPVSLVPIVYFKETIAFFKERIYLLAYVLLVFVSALFGSNNERLMAPVFAVFYYLIAVLFMRTTGRIGWLKYLIIAAAFISSFDFWAGLHPLPDRATMMKVDLICLGVVTIAVTLSRFLRGGRLHETG